MHVSRISYLINYYSIGTKIQGPRILNSTESADGKSVTHSWEHDSENIVSHYNLIFMAANGSQVFQFNIVNTSITVPSTTIDLNGMLSAVSVCGDESEQINFNVTIALMLHTM